MVRVKLVSLVIQFISQTFSCKIQWKNYYSHKYNLQELHSQPNFKKLVANLKKNPPLTPQQIDLVKSSLPPQVVFSLCSLRLLKHTILLKILNRINVISWKDIVIGDTCLQEIYTNHYTIFRSKVRTLTETLQKSKIIFQCKDCNVKFTSNCFLTFGLQCFCESITDLLDFVRELPLFTCVLMNKGETLLGNVVSITDYIPDTFKDYSLFIDTSGYKLKSVLASTPEDNVIVQKYTQPHSKCGGVLFSLHLDLVYSTKCFLIDSSFCKCTVKCCYRNLGNSLKNRERWYPLSISKVDPYTFKEILFQKPLKKSIGSFLHLDFYTRIVLKSEKLQVSTRKTYTNSMKSMYNNGLLCFITCPSTFLKLSQQIYSNSTLVKNFGILLVYLNNLGNDDIKRFYSPFQWTFVMYLKVIYYNIFNQLKGKSVIHTKSTRQMSNWVTWEELQDVVEQLKQCYISEPTIDNLQSYLGYKLCIYQNTLRNDYSSLKFKDYNTESDNYINLESKCIVWNKFKTSKHHGTISYPINAKVLQELELLVGFRTRENKYSFIFVNYLDSQMTNEQFGNMIRSISKFYIGKSIGTQIMRTVRVSEFRKNDISYQKEQEFSHNMQHTAFTSRTIYRKI